MQTDGDSPVTVVEVLAVEEELTPAGIVEELAPAVAVEVLGSSEAVSAATSDACVCSECNKVHPQSNFSRNQWRKPVEQRRCKACVEESLPKPKPSKVEVQRMAREEEARRKLEDSQHCQELESGCYSVPPPCCCLVCFWLQFDKSKTRFILGPGNQCIFPWPFPCCIYRYVRPAARHLPAGAVRSFPLEFSAGPFGEDCCGTVYDERWLCGGFCPYICNFTDNFIFGSNTTFSRTIPASSRSALDSEREAALRRSAELRWQNFREGGDLNIQIHTAETQQGYAKWSMKWPPYDGPAFACI